MAKAEAKIAELEARVKELEVLVAVMLETQKGRDAKIVDLIYRSKGYEATKEAMEEEEQKYFLHRLSCWTNDPLKT